MKIAIYGATGFIGTALTKRYIDTNTEVHIFVRSPNKLPTEYQKHHNIHVHLVFDTLPDDIDIFYYLTWDNYERYSQDPVLQCQNIDLLLKCLEKINTKIKRFVFCSSFSEFKLSDTGSCDVYGSVKHSCRLIAQSYCDKYGIEFIAVAFACVFGPGDYSRRTPNVFIKRLLNNEHINLSSGIYDWIYIDNCIDGLVDVGEHGNGSLLHYIGSNPKQYFEIIDAAKMVLNSNSIINPGEYKDRFKLVYPENVHYHYMNNICFDEAIRRIASWVQQISY